jgi:hypothetical protein
VAQDDALNALLDQLLAGASAFLETSSADDRAALTVCHCNAYIAQDLSTQACFLDRAGDRAGAP